MVQDDFGFFKKRGFGQQLGIGKKPCLIVVDMITGFTDETMPMGSNVDKEIKNINEIIKSARLSDIPIIFTSIVYSDSTIENNNIWREKMDGLNTLKKGTEAVTIDSRLDYNSKDDLVLKKYASAFFGTDLVSLLNTENIDTVIITGCTTSGCVRATVVDAVQYGYRPIVVEDAVGDRSEASHNQSIFDMEQKYSDVLTTHYLLESLKNTVDS